MAKDITLTISDDGQKATVSSIAANVTAEDIVNVLRESGVTYGIRSSVLVDAINEVKKSGNPAMNVVVAQGDAPKFKVPPRLENKLTEGKLPALGTVSKLLTLRPGRAVQEAVNDVTALAVRKGDLLAEKVVGELEPGTSVKGEPIEEVSLSDMGPQFEQGFGTSISSDGNQYTAKFSGFAGLLEGKVSVLPPVWITEDGMAAAYLNLPLLPESVQFSTDDIHDLLSAAGVTVGCDEKRIQELCRSLAQGIEEKVLVLLAKGTPGEDPVDGNATFLFQAETQAGSQQKSGAIDFKERSTLPSVAKDEVVAEGTPPVPGKPGVTVTDDDVEVKEPGVVELIAGDNVREEKEGETVKLLSEIDGGASIVTVETPGENGLIRHTVSVRVIAQISGNVDYETGNIDFEGNVDIKGRVVGGFKVKASGDVIVGEGVEDGAEILADGGLTVRQGIVGKNTSIVVKGDVQARFIQDAMIQGDGEVKAEVYIRSANVRTSGDVVVEGKGSSGGIMGGETWALKTITSNNVGAEANASTLVSVGALPDLFDDFKGMKVDVEKARETKMAILKAIGIQSLKPDLIKQSIIANPLKKTQILKLVHRANEMAKTEAGSLGSMNELAKKMQNSAKEAYLDVTNEAHTRVKVRIGNIETVLTEDLKAVRFSLDKTDKSTGIVWSAIADIGKEKKAE
jgi:uncharacterized protein (DUF342 family)